MTAQQKLRFTVAVVEADGSRKELPVREGQHVLGAMNAQGKHIVQVGCRGGGCGVCRVQVLEGKYECLPMSKKHVSDAEKGEGYALACRLVPKSDLVMRKALRAPAKPSV